jgi:hypothetical protein
MKLTSLIFSGTACVAHALQEHVDKAKLFREPQAF